MNNDRFELLYSAVNNDSGARKTLCINLAALERYSNGILGRLNRSINHRAMTKRLGKKSVTS